MVVTWWIVAFFAQCKRTDNENMGLPLPGISRCFLRDIHAFIHLFLLPNNYKAMKHRDFTLS